MNKIHKRNHFRQVNFVNNKKSFKLNAEYLFKETFR